MCIQDCFRGFICIVNILLLGAENREILGCSSKFHLTSNQQDKALWESSYNKCFLLGSLSPCSILLSLAIEKNKVDGKTFCPSESMCSKATMILGKAHTQLGPQTSHQLWIWCEGMQLPLLLQTLEILLQAPKPFLAWDERQAHF